MPKRKSHENTLQRSLLHSRNNSKIDGLNGACSQFDRFVRARAAAQQIANIAGVYLQLNITEY